MSYRFTKRLEVQFRDCDPLGHVNNAVYITYLEIARFAYCADALAFTPDMATGPLSFIIARVECNFRSQARLGDELDVRIRLADIGRSSFVFEYEVVHAREGRVVADGRSVQVMYDYSRQQSVAVPDDFRARAERFEQRIFAKSTLSPVI
jgi:acyl-CoA thioester hydrolase